MGAPSTPPIHIVRFSVFELNLRSGELRRAGTRINLQEQSFQTLALLLEHPGDVVTREELRQRLWPADTFVDFERGLNAAIKRLRDTLGDSAESPRFVETLHRRGYRFIAPVELGAARANRSDEAGSDDGSLGDSADPPRFIQTVPRPGDRFIAPVDGAAETPNQQPGAQSVVVEQMPAGRSTPLRGWIGKGAAIGVAAVILVVASIALVRKAPPATGAPARIAAAHEVGRQRGMARIRSGRRAGRLRVVGREVRQHRHLRHISGLHRRSASHDRSGRRLRTELVARRAAHCLPPSSRAARCSYSCHFRVGWARSGGERFSGGRQPTDTLSSACTSRGRPTGAMLSQAEMPAMPQTSPRASISSRSRAAQRAP